MIEKYTGAFRQRDMICAMRDARCEMISRSIAQPKVPPLLFIKSDLLKRDDFFFLSFLVSAVGQ